MDSPNESGEITEVLEDSLESRYEPLIDLLQITSKKDNFVITLPVEKLEQSDEFQSAQKEDILYNIKEILSNQEYFVYIRSSDVREDTELHVYPVEE